MLFAPGAGLKEKLLLFRSGIFHAADFIFSRGGPKSSYCWGKMSSGSSVWGWLLFLGQTAKKKMLRNSTVLCFLWVHFSFLAGKRKKKPPSDFLLPCVSFTPSLLLLFFCCGRGRAVIPHFAFSSAASSSFYFWGDSAVAIRTNGTHTHQTTGTQFMWDFSHLLFLLLSLISHWRNPISILIWTPWDISRKRSLDSSKSHKVWREKEKREKN